MMHSQVNAMAPGKRLRRAINASKARTAVARSPYPIITLNSVGTLTSTAPGARIVPPAMRKTWIQSNGIKAISRGSTDRRGTTYQNAMRVYATKRSEEHTSELQSHVNL